MADFLLICNPIAGNGASVAALKAAMELLDSEKADYTVRYSEYPAHAVELAAQAVSEGHGCVVAVGGDGTIREVGLSLINTGVPMGIIPCGTGNDYVRATGIPTDVTAAVNILLHGRRQRVDAGRINGKLFLNVAGFGFDVEVLDSTELYKKKFKNGSLAYIAGLLRALTRLRLRKTHFVLDDGTEKDFNALIVAIGNGTHFGGGMNITPLADPTDGLLDVCVAHDVGILSLLSTMPKLMKGEHIHTKYATCFKVKSIKAVCEPASRIEVDGEVMEGTPIEAEVLPQSMVIMVANNG